MKRHRAERQYCFGGGDQARPDSGALTSGSTANNPK
jgi:hypothetical protein